MEFKIYFCKDGVLRVKGPEKDPMIPLKTIQNLSPKALKENDFKFWTTWWDSQVFFEEGLTVAKFLIALEPWEEFWGDFTQKDVAAYIKEARTPVAVTQKQDDLDWISLYKYVELEPETKYHEDSELKESDDLLNWLNSPKKTKITGSWNLSMSYRLSGYVKGEEEQYSVEDSPIYDLANTLFVLSPSQVVCIPKYGFKKHFGDNYELFSKEPYGVYDIKKGGIYALKGDCYHKIKDIVEAFFWWRASTPEKRDEFVAELKASIEELDLETQDQTSEEAPSSEGPREIKIAPGAFDSMIERHDSISSIWKSWLKDAKKDSASVLKIGQARLAAPVEDRIFKYLEDNLEEDSKPKGSDFVSD